MTRRRPPLALAFASLLALAACGGMVVVDASHDPGEGGAPVDSGAPPVDAAMDAMTKPPPDAAGDAAAACDDDTVCSWLINHDDACLGPASVGDFCDFLATPCSSTPPDCATISAIVGVDAHLASCGNGLSFCDVDWVGTLSAKTLELLCSAHAAAGQPLDCVLD